MDFLCTCGSFGGKVGRTDWRPTVDLPNRVHLERCPAPKALLWLKTRKPLLFDIAAKSSKLSNQSSHNRAISPWGIRSEQARHIAANFRDRLGKPPKKLFNCMTSLPWKTAKGKYMLVSPMTFTPKPKLRKTFILLQAPKTSRQRRLPGTAAQLLILLLISRRLSTNPSCWASSPSCGSRTRQVLKAFGWLRWESSELYNRRYQNVY